MSNPKIVLATRKDPRTEDRYQFARMLTSMPQSVPTHVLYGVFVSSHDNRIKVDLSDLLEDDLSLEILQRFLDERDLLDNIDLVEVVLDQDLVESELERRSNAYLDSILG